MESVLIANFLFILLGLVITAQAQDCSTPSGANMVLSDADILKTSFPDGSKVRFDCIPGYSFNGPSRTITCSAGTWSTLTSTCERKNCGNPGQLDNGDIEYLDDDVLFGDRIKFKCHEGYNLVGKSESNCLAQGWSGRMPKCEVLKCDPPPDITNGGFSEVKEYYSYGELVTYKCDGGLTLNGSSMLKCTENEFMPNPPACIKVQCENVKNATRIGGGPPPYGYKHHVTFKCISGHGNEEEFSLDCGLDSQWLPVPPKCEPNKVRPTTTTPRSPTTGKVPPSPTPTKVTTSGQPTTVGPTDSGTKWWQSWWFISLAVVSCVAITAYGCRYFGCLAFIKNKKGKRCSPADATLLAVKAAA